MIPKIIHYCWFGKNKKNQLVLDCIESWKKYLPDYQIREWNDDDLINCSNVYVRQAYTNKKWAFISDYFRLYALYNYGGIYFDSDNEVFKSLDEFLCHSFFSGYENYQGIISPFTAVLVAQKGNKIIKNLLDEYENLKFEKDGNLDLKPNTERVSEYFKLNYNLNEYTGKEITILEEDHVLYPYYYFCTPLEGKECYAIHHFNGSWDPRFSIKTIHRIKIFKDKYLIIKKYKCTNSNCIDYNFRKPNNALFSIRIWFNRFIVFFIEKGNR